MRSLPKGAISPRILALAFSPAVGCIVKRIDQPTSHSDGRLSQASSMSASAHLPRHRRSGSLGRFRLCGRVRSRRRSLANRLLCVTRRLVGQIPKERHAEIAATLAVAGSAVEGGWNS
jgi:hypothetical protein